VKTKEEVIVEFKASKKDIVRLMSRCQGATAKTPTTPALGCVLLSAKAKTLTVSATDLYVSISGSVTSTVATKGTVAVHAKDLLERLKAMPDGDVIVTADSNHVVTVKADGSPRKFKLPGLNGADFPGVLEPGSDATECATIAPKLSRMLELTHFSVSQDETRPHVNSLLVEFAGDVMRAVSTDGHRLSLAELESNNAPSMTMLLPLRGVLELRKLVGSATDEIASIVYDGKTAFFSVDGVRLGVRVVDAQFPPYQQVIPKAHKQWAKLSRALFSDALNAIRVAASAQNGGVNVTLLPGSVRISCEDEGGSAVDEIATDYDGPEVTIGFCARYLLDVLNVIPDDEVVLSTGEPTDPATLRGVSDNGQHVAVVMPMRVR
jgi:DNA polymerase-3 subunit beta